MADIETTLMSLNPMDFVTGMRKGFELGSSRASEEQAKAQAQVETTKAGEFVSQPSTELRLAQVEANRAGADLTKALYGIENRVAAEGGDVTVAGRLQQLRNINTAATTRGVTLAGEQFREPTIQQQKNIAQEQDVRNFPEAERRRQEAFNFEGVKADAERGNFDATQKLTRATRGAADALVQIGNDPRYANADAWDRAEAAIGVVNDPYARELLRQEQRKYAAQQLQRSGGNPGLISTWLPRIDPNIDVRLRADGTMDIGRPVKTKARDPGTGEIIDKVVLRYENYSNDPNAGRLYIGNFIDEVSGQQRGFQTQVQRQPGAAPTAEAAALADQRGGGGGVPVARGQGAPAQPPAQPSAPAQQPQQLSGPSPQAAVPNVPQALVTEPPGTPGVRRQPTAAGAGTTGPQADRQELDSMLDRVASLPRQAKASDPRVFETLSAISQLRQSEGGLNPDVLQKLRTLVDTIAPTRAAPRPSPTTQIGQAIGQAIPTPAPPKSPEATIDRLLQMQR